MNNLFRFAILLLGVVSLLAIGCMSEPEIVRHRIPKDRSGLEKLRETAVPRTTSVPPAPGRKTRMAVAIFEKPDATWFFKVAGPSDQVDASEDQWKAFFEAVKFKNGDPTWDLPAGWSNAGQKPMRFATLIIGDTKPGLELAISKLGPKQNLLDNANRWRGQIGLDAAPEDQLDLLLKRQKSESGEYFVFDALGTGSGQMTAPFAGGGAAPFVGGGGPFAGGQTAGPLATVEYEIPDGWTKLDSSRMVQLRLEKEVDGARAQITIIELPADANEWEPNVIRWAGQVGLSGLSKEQFAERTSDVKIDGVDGKIVDLIDLESEAPNGMIGGMVKHHGSAWFLKITGDKQLVDDSREAFDRLNKSIRFK